MYKEINLFGSGAVLHHIGIAVKSIADFSAELEVTIDPIQKVGVAFFRTGGSTIELVEPAGEDSPIQGFLSKKQSIYHACYEVPSMEDALVEARSNRFIIVAQPAPASAFDGREIAWVLHRSLGLYELLAAE